MNNNDNDQKMEYKDENEKKMFKVVIMHFSFVCREEIL